MELSGEYKVPIKMNMLNHWIMGNVIFSLLWLIILIFISFWIAGICAGIYIIVLPFTVCIEPLSGLTDFLLTVIQFPRYCAQAMMDGRGFG